jgi:hypothetical protein
MPVAQVIRFDERQAIGRPRRATQTPHPGVVLRFPRNPSRPAMPAVQMLADEDRHPGRGRDPG